VPLDGRQAVPPGNRPDRSAEATAAPMA
jgi:hypothetical protein